MGVCCRYDSFTIVTWLHIRHIRTKQEDPDGGWKNEQITTALWDELIDELHGLCRVAAEVSVFIWILHKCMSRSCTVSFWNDWAWLTCLKNAFVVQFQKLLCAYAFPRCTIRDGRPKMLPLCYEDCVATHQQFCYTDWILLEEKRDRGIPLKTRGHFRLPDCKSLPRYNRSTAAEHPTCSYVGLTEMNPDDITCKLGEFYQRRRKQSEPIKGKEHAN